MRLGAAAALPLVVPGIIIAILWALPGDPAEIICPPEICDGTAALAARWGLDRGPLHFYVDWLTHAVHGEFGNSWRVQQGLSVGVLLKESAPMTSALAGLAALWILGGAALAAAGRLPRRLDPVLTALGLVPSVILALVAAAYVELTYGPMSWVGWPGTLRLLLGAAVLGVADGTLSAAVVGTRATFETERRRRYVTVARLRGESVLSNMLPNVAVALVGQLRARLLQILSGTVVVEVVLGIPGLGELLFDGTLRQDFGVVLAAAWIFSVLSALLLVGQAVVELGAQWWVRRVPAGLTQAIAREAT